MKFRTWMAEALVVAILLCIAPAIKGDMWEFLGALAVLLSFMHGQIADRHSYAEREASRKGEVKVECWRWSTRYFIGKETVWVLYFIHLKAWSALVGCGLFLMYPVWRRYWTNRKRNTK